MKPTLKKTNLIPFDPAKFPFFYGWIILIMSTLGILVSIPGQTMGVAAFTDHLMDALNMTRGQLSLAYMGGTILSALLLTHVGKLFDRLGARIMGTAACLLLGTVLVLISQCDRIANLLSIIFGLQKGLLFTFPVILICFFLLRLSGQGTLTLVSRNMLMKWFDRRRGFVNGVSGLFVSFGFSSAPLLMATLINVYDWRITWLIFAVIAGILFTLLIVIFARDNPEDCGLLPDGEKCAAHLPKSTVHTVHRQFTLCETRKTFSFWVFALPLAMNALYTTGLTFHIESIFKQAGMGAKEAFAIFLPGAIISVSLNFLSGWLSDRIHLKYLLIAMLIASFAAFTGFFFLANGWAKWLLTVGYGGSIGFWGVLMSVTWPRFFGREHLGAISGFTMSLIVFASAVGPYSLSTSLTYTGSYGIAIIGCAIFNMVLLVCALRVKNPQESLNPK